MLFISLISDVFSSDLASACADDASSQNIGANLKNQQDIATIPRSQRRPHADLPRPIPPGFAGASVTHKAQSPGRRIDLGKLEHCSLSPLVLALAGRTRSHDLHWPPV